MNKTLLTQAACWSLVVSVFGIGALGIWIFGESLGLHQGLENVGLYAAALAFAVAMLLLPRVKRFFSTRLSQRPAIRVPSAEPDRT